MNIEDVVSKLELALPGRNTIARSSLSQARDRVGSESLRDDLVNGKRSEHRWRDLKLYGIDGSTVRVPDTPENREAFGGQSGREGTESGYPMVRLVALMVLGSHLLAGCSIGGSGANEIQYAWPLLDAIPAQSLTVLDRGFFGARFLLSIQAKEDRHWLTRARSDLSFKVVKKFARGDQLIELTVSAHARKQDASLPTTWQMRAIRYKRKGFPEQWLLTSLRDPIRYPADEIIQLYHERWELELGYDEIKTELLAREETIWSRKPDGVR